MVSPRPGIGWGRGVSAIRGHQSAGLWGALLFLITPDAGTSGAEPDLVTIDQGCWDSPWGGRWVAMIERS